LAGQPGAAHRGDQQPSPSPSQEQPAWAPPEHSHWQVAPAGHSIVQPVVQVTTRLEPASQVMAQSPSGQSSMQAYPAGHVQSSGPQVTVPPASIRLAASTSPPLPASMLPPPSSSPPQAPTRNRAMRSEAR